MNPTTYAAFLSALLSDPAGVDAAAHRALLMLTVAAAVVLSLLLWTYPPRRRSRSASMAVDEPSGPVVPAAELLPHTTWIPDVDHRHPETLTWGDIYAWRNRHRGVHRAPRTGAVCARTQEIPAVEEVISAH